MAIAPTGGAAAAALQAYRSTQAQTGGAPGADASGESAGGGGFGEMLGRALEGVVNQGRQAESLSTQGIQGQGSILDIVTAVSKAELSLQTTIAVRDRVVQAYQDIMRMPI
jgi:flagellar hook-basal body complex protein FliE